MQQHTDRNKDEHSSTSAKYETISDDDEQPGECKAKESSETCSTEDNSLKKETDNTKNTDTERTPVRRSRSKEDEGEKGSSDELQKEERNAKKAKTDEDPPRPQSQRVLRSRVARPDLSKMHTLEDFGYRFNESTYSLIIFLFVGKGSRLYHI